MLPYQQIVDEIRSFLQASDQTLTDEVKQLAAAYADACRDCNDRLRRCADFLGKGLQTEAIQYSRAAPDLVELAVALNFPERSEWEELAAMYGLPAPPRLTVDTVAALEGTAAAVQPLEHSLREHRRLALARAPIRQRLDVLRRLAQVNPTNPAWAGDIQQLERARLAEFTPEISAAAGKGNIAELAKIWDEIARAPWTNAPPLSTVQELVRRCLGTVETAFAEAYFHRQLIQGRQTRDVLSQIARLAQIPPHDALWKRVAAALDWVSEHDRQDEARRVHQDAIAALEKALDDNKPAVELERCFQAVRKGHQGVPGELRTRYQQRIKQFAHASNRQENYFLIAAVILVLILALAFAAWLISRP